MIDRAALRACARIAWRQARRAPGRSALVVLLVAIPVAGLVGAGNVISTAFPTPEERATAEMGTADLSLGYTGDLGLGDLQRALPAGSRVASSMYLSREHVVDGSRVGIGFVEVSIALDQEPIRGMFQLLTGRAPEKRGEAVVYPQTLRQHGLVLGDRLQIDDVGVIVTGTAVRPLRMREPVAVVGPGTIDGYPEASISDVLIDLPPGADVSEAQEALGSVSGFGGRGSGAVRTRETITAYHDDDPTVATAVSFAATIVVLLATGLIMAAAFAVGLRRQVRMIGSIAAAGADPRHVRAVVRLGGTSLGGLGGVVGMMVGVAAAYLAAPHLGELTGSMPGDVSLNIPVLAGSLVLAIAGGTIAAATAARAASRLTTVDALAMRLPPPPAPWRTARMGVLLLAVGGVGTGAATVATQRVGLAAGLVAMLVGALLLLPMVVSWLARVSPHLPTAWMLAARDSARQGRRTATALAAAALALAIPVAVSAASLSEEALGRRTSLIGDEQLLIGSLETKAAAHLAALREPLLAAFPGATFEALRPVHFPAGSYLSPDGERAAGPWDAVVYGATRAITSGPNAGGGGVETVGGELMIGTPALLRSLDAAQGIGALAAGEVVAIGANMIEDGTVSLQLPPGPDGTQKTRSMPAVDVEVARDFSVTLPRFLISAREAVRRSMVAGEPARYLFDDPRPLDRADIVRAKRIVASMPDAFAQSLADLQPAGKRSLRAAVTAVSALIALTIVAVTVSLVRAETRRDVAILAAIGAGPKTRRFIAAAGAALLAAMAGVVAALAGFAPVAVIQGARDVGVPIVVPWQTFAAVLGVVPVIAGIVAGMTSRKPNVPAMLQPIS